MGNISIVRWGASLALAALVACGGGSDGDLFGDSKTRLVWCEIEPAGKQP